MSPPTNSHSPVGGNPHGDQVPKIPHKYSEQIMVAVDGRNKANEQQSLGQEGSDDFVQLVHGWPTSWN